LLLQDHRTVLTGNGLQQPVHSDITALSDGRVDKAQFIVRSHQGTTTGTERSSVLGGKQQEKVRSERVVVGHSMLVQQPPGMNDLSPRVERRVDSTSRVDISANWR